VDKAICSFGAALATGKLLIVDFSKTRAVDQRFLGLLLMVRKQVKARGGELQFTGISPTLLRIFRLNGIEHLLAGAVN
jgi:N-acetylglucosaminyldiphosphoundecaprenol N-acetyl-beta-D-mannosaminyltransferase